MNNSFFKHITIYIILFGIISVLQSCSGCSQSSILSRTKNTSSKSSDYTKKKAEQKPRSEPAIVPKEVPPPPLKKKPEEPRSYPDIKTENKRSVAQLFKELQQGVFMVYAYDNPNAGSYAQGSGFFINKKGIGITNFHVLEGFKNYEIKTSNGKSYRIIEILESSDSKDNDYVIFRIEDVGIAFKDLPIAKTRPLIGEDVFAIGSPKGLQNSLTKGSVSQYRTNNRIQIDATIEHGSSGGPLFNMNGEVIGITSAKMEDTDAALNFAVDIQVVPFQKYVKKKVATKNSTILQSFLLPTSTTGQMIKHTYFTVSFSDDDKQPEWVAYKTSLKNFNNHIKRTNDYRPDPSVKTGSADTYDYYSSGYDMGHLAPARTMSHNNLSMSESFYLSNISPQVPAFNRGIWKKLEAKVRYWTAMNDSLYVVTGPILKMPIDIIGDNDVTVPRAFYKTLVGFKNGKIKGIAFIMPNQKSKKHIYTFVTSIDHVEELTGIDFYHNLNIQIQEEIESNKDIKKWSLK